jgi:hypothetical protein
MGTEIDSTTLQEEVKDAIRKKYMELYRQQEFFKKLYEATGEEIYWKQIVLLEEKLKWLKAYL